jgi:GNAT superfamily N-acetyltransferase
MRIEVDNLTRPQVLALLSEHLANMHEITPSEYVFALDAAKLRQPGVTFWTAWEGEELVGCGALKELSPTEGEVKSMRTPQALRRRGAGRAILQTIVEAARKRGYRFASRLRAGAATLREFWICSLRAVWRLCGEWQQRVYAVVAVNELAGACGANWAKMQTNATAARNRWPLDSTCCAESGKG